MQTLLIDIETYSSVDIAKCGLHKYVESPDFAVLLFAYSVDDAPAVLVDLACGEEIPEDVRHACYDPSVVKVAHNMAFEITCLSRHFGQSLSADQWHDTMVMGAYLGLPLKLADVGRVLNLTEQKDASGTRLIRLFSCPQARTGKRVMPCDKPEQWEEFKRYCLQDVDTETALYKKVRGRIPVPAWERELQLADYRINQRGVRVDTVLAENAVRFWDEAQEHLMAELKSVTHLENPGSVVQLKTWLAKYGCRPASLDKATVQDLLKSEVLTRSVRRALEIRQELGKTSVKKYHAMLQCACADGRARGITQYYGTMTGRWSGRMIQTQNLPQNHIEDLAYARKLLADGEYEEMEISYDSVTDTLSQLIRTALVPSEGRVFHVCDFSAIEGRVIAWLAGEKWVLDVFRAGGDIYCATASQMFGVPVEKHGQNAALRQKGKIATLALGYQGGVGALKAMGGDRMGLTDDEMRTIMQKWRRANPSIVRLWDNLERAAQATIITGQPHTVNQYITYSMHFGFLFATLPSGRSIAYPRARIVTDNGRQQIEYERTDQETHKWGRVRTYGGKLAENVVQAIARDILAMVILRCEKAELPIVFHVHDEVIIDSPRDRKLEEVEKLFSDPIPWCPGLPLKGAGYTCDFYMKD